MNESDTYSIFHELKSMVSDSMVTSNNGPSYSRGIQTKVLSNQQPLDLDQSINQSLLNLPLQISQTPPISNLTPIPMYKNSIQTGRWGASELFSGTVNCNQKGYVLSKVQILIPCQTSSQCIASLSKSLAQEDIHLISGRNIGRPEGSR